MAKLIKIDTARFARNLDAYKGSVMRNTVTGAQILMSQNENRAKQQRKWRDRSGQARSSITGSYKSDGEGVTIGLAIGADHGIFLEKANGGKYAIVYPTVLETQKQLLEIGRVALSSGGTR
jgi:hypothetical protein